MLDFAMQEFFMQMMTGMMKDLMPGGNYECVFNICDFKDKTYKSVINSYYGNFEYVFSNGEDASEYITLSPEPQTIPIPDPEGDFSGDDVPMKNIEAIPLEIGTEVYVSIDESMLQKWFDNYEELGYITFNMESVYPLEVD